MKSPKYLPGFRRLLLAGSLAALAMSAPAFAAKDVVLAVASTFTTLDPYDANDTLSMAVAKSFYQGLFGFDKDMKLINVLAESYEPSADGLTYTIKLKSGIKFHDGTDFNAAAVKANFDRVTNPDNKLKRYGLFNRIAKTEAIDAATVKFTLKEPFSPFINVLAHPSGVIISPAAMQKYGKDIAFNPVGTGPFTFVEWKQTDYLKVKKFDGFWQKGLPKVDTLTWKPVIDNNTRATVMQTGEAHFAYPLPFEQAEKLKQSDKVDVVAGSSIVQRWLAMNTLQKPFNDPKVRQAVNYAINKEAVAKVAFAGYAVPAEGPVPPGVEYAQRFGVWPYDPAKAKQLLAEAGYPNGFETTLWSAYNHSTAQKVIEVAQQQLAQVGIKAQIQALEAGQRVERVESWKDPQTAPVRMYYIGWSSSTGEADWALRPLLASEAWPPGLLNTAYYKNELVDANIAKALNTTDKAEKEKLYKAAQEQIWKDAPWVFLVTEKMLYARAKNVSGIYVMPDASYEYSEIDIK
ncbi:MAG: glutathione ABC transporter substrate-binding protein GsiB [Candidatus Accumulibacter sp.]|jgi:glutathione transport system substrate-binding protein|nr:glutathione ABC transporter substrate-binding protein GsiB [Accumulibacter sp.]